MKWQENGEFLRNDELISSFPVAACSAYRVPEHEGVIAQAAFIRRDTPWQILCLGIKWMEHSVL